MQLDYGASSVSQLVFSEFLKSGLYADHLVQIRRILKKRHDSALEVLKKHFSDLATWNSPLGGFYIWLKFKTQINMDALFQNALDKNILLNPGHIYDFKHNNSIRLSYSYVDSDLFEKAMIELARIVRKMNKQ